ncbi:MAG TPA: phosphoenolpyruvate hydrolase family protein, partial [Planctomycetota bacterium]|nr:phosphoenolpyruvate hydrolase family protein [Planctomycetota bacterium]
IAAAARKVRPDVLLICHGGAIAEPKDAAYVLEHCPGIHGFYGASSMERLPAERAIQAQTEAFTQLALARPTKSPKRKK